MEAPSSLEAASHLARDTGVPLELMYLMDGADPGGTRRGRGARVA